MLYYVILRYSCYHVSACGGTLTSLAGAIQSPNFPNNYTNGLSCIYVIKPNSKGVTLTFTSFDLEHESACGYDYVEVSVAAVVLAAVVATADAANTVFVAVIVILLLAICL